MNLARQGSGLTVLMGHFSCLFSIKNLLHCIPRFRVLRVIKLDIFVSMSVPAAAGLMEYGKF